MFLESKPKGDIFSSMETTLEKEIYEVFMGWCGGSHNNIGKENQDCPMKRFANCNYLVLQIKPKP